MHIDDILASMRDGEPQSNEAIAAFVRGVTDGTVSRPQAAAWLAWAFVRRLSDTETVALTREMTQSGDVLHWGHDGGRVIDKHSTGGVGDKVSLVLAPLWAELGYRVPMISGRGLGHTGGTLDKLESIPGYRTDRPLEELQQQLSDVGCFITGQTGELAPADRVLYALRNETCTVANIPLIVGSILSKKLAAGVHELVLDVKTGNGAFMERLEDATELAEAMVAVAEGAGVPCTALITAMDRPLGVKVGNALEVEESIDTLKGGGPDDLRDCTLALARDPRAAAVLASGAAYERFCRMVEAQGGDVRALDDTSRLLGSGTQSVVVSAEQEGFMQLVHARQLGVAAFRLGAGRSRAEDPVDMGVGLEVHVNPGDRVERGQPLVTLHHRAGHALDEATELVKQALRIGESAPPAVPLVHATVSK